MPTFNDVQFGDNLGVTDLGGGVIRVDAGGPAGGASRIVEIKVVDDATVVTTGENKLIFCIPAALNGLSLSAVAAFVTTVSSSGIPSVGVRNVTTGFEMLTTNVTIDANETTSYTAATAAVIDAARKVVSTGDLVAIDVDAAGTGARGLGTILTFA